ncbi:hypothetical protein [Catenovulum sediminis]|uniref:hypothetical protein n=1 Tax=Catenovulum sediminis TaxID=1740262 RepID=UPI00117E23F5|nr:hypothetical protein [Catenovulum sediminis]
MNEHETHAHSQAEEDAEKVPDDVLLKQALESWKRTFTSYENKWHASRRLVLADASVSLKALFICLISVLLLAGVVMTIWIVINIGIAYGLSQAGLFWYWVFATILIFNFVLLFALRHIFKQAKQAIPLRESINAFFSHSE